MAERNASSGESPARTRYSSSECRLYPGTERNIGVSVPAPIGTPAEQVEGNLRVGLAIEEMGRRLRGQEKETMAEHKHQPQGWDGYYERCACGAVAGDRRDPKTGVRYSTFKEWDQ